jgi:hypothetical protein
MDHVDTDMVKNWKGIQEKGEKEIEARKGNIKGRKSLRD